MGRNRRIRPSPASFGVEISSRAAENLRKNISKYRKSADLSQGDVAAVLKSKVFFEILRRGGKAYNGKIGRNEISFVVVNGGERVYIQVTDKITPDNRRKLFDPLRHLKDYYPKVVLSLHDENYIEKDGIYVVNALDYLMGKPLLGQTAFKQKNKSRLEENIT